jgi:hypothetical protein
MAQGDLMQGYAYIALGVSDTATSPICADDASDLTKTRPITAPTPGQCMEDGKTCPLTGHTVWSDSDKLCLKGSIPVVTGGDYTNNWGLQIGANTGNPPAADGGNTLGQNSDKASSYTTITVTTSGSITAGNGKTKPAVRVVLHVKSMSCTEDPYCATMVSGQPILLTSFSTQCWSTACKAPCKKLTADDIPNIDKVGIQICADTTTSYTADPYCLDNIVFGTN